MPMFALAVCYVVFNDLSNYVQLIVFGQGCGMLLNVLFLKVDTVHILQNTIVPSRPNPRHILL